MSEITMSALVDETVERLAKSSDSKIEPDIIYFRGVLAILLGYRAVADVLEPKK